MLMRHKVSNSFPWNEIFQHFGKCSFLPRVKEKDKYNLAEQEGFQLEGPVQL